MTMTIDMAAATSPDDYTGRRARTTVRGIRTYLIRKPRPDEIDRRPELVGMWGGFWRPGVNVATCRESPIKVTGNEHLTPNFAHLTPERFGEDHESPSEDCHCGYYSYVPTLDEMFSFHPQTTVGELFAIVEGWGKVLVGTRGWRAEKARLIALAPNWGAPYLPTERHVLGPLLADLQDRYQVRILPNPMELVKAFPLPGPLGLPVSMAAS